MKSGNGNYYDEEENSSEASNLFKEEIQILQDKNHYNLEMREKAESEEDEVAKKSQPVEENNLKLSQIRTDLQMRTQYLTEDYVYKNIEKGKDGNGM